MAAASQPVNPVVLWAQGGEPTFVELIAAERIMPHIHDALRYTLAVVAARRPIFLPVHRRVDELLLAVSVALEAASLWKADCSFAEGFHGLCRVRRHPDGTMRRLGNTERLCSLLALAFLPFALAKLRRRRQDRRNAAVRVTAQSTAARAPRPDALDETMADAPEPRHWSSAAEDQVATALEALAVGERLAWHLAHAFGFTRVWTSLLCALNVRHVRLSALAARHRPAPNIAVERLRAGTMLLVDLVKVLHWWYSPRANAPATAPKPLPRPPSLQPRPGARALPRDKGHCPICGQPRENATAAPSGYVFCYRCIHSAVELNGRCPLTLMPTTVDSLRKVYEDGGAGAA